jgi:glucokinase
MGNPKLQSMVTIGVDVGGTKIAAGLVEFPGGRVLDERVVPTRSARGGLEMLAELECVCHALVSHGDSCVERVSGIGIGICELVDPSGRITSANSFDWINLPVAERMGKFAPTVVIDADVRAAALAESLFGAGRPFGIFLYVTVGTGISCSLMLQGQPLLGAHGETGTMASSPLGVICECCGQENQQTLEEIASGPALVSRFNRRRDAAAQTGHDVVRAADQGDADAIHVLQTAGRTLGANVGLLVNVLDPEAVVVGGGLGVSEGLYWESLVRSTRHHIWSPARRDLPILRAETGESAGLIGAAALAWLRCTGQELCSEPLTPQK